MYKTALASGVETPEQTLQRQVLTTLLGRSGATSIPGTINTSTNADGSPAPPGETHVWMREADGTVDYSDPSKHIAVRKGAARGGGGDPRVQQRLWYKDAVQEAMRSPEMQAYGKLVLNPVTGKPDQILWTDPIGGRAALDKLIEKNIMKFQMQGVLPTPFLGIGGEGEAAPVERPKVIP